MHLLVQNIRPRFCCCYNTKSDFHTIGYYVSGAWLDVYMSPLIFVLHWGSTPFYLDVSVIGNLSLALEPQNNNIHPHVINLINTWVLPVKTYGC